MVAGGEITVVLVDDHDILREALKNSLQAGSNIKVIAEARNSAECWEALSRHTPDVVVLDLSLPGRGGGDVLLGLKQRYPEIKVLVLSAHQEDEYAIKLIRLGATGYLHKSTSLDGLIAGIEKVNEGELVVSDDLMRMMTKQAFGESATALHEALSVREHEVMLMLARSRSVTGISKELNLSVKTISTYRKRILDKLDLASNEEIASYARLNNLLQEDH